MNLFELFVKIGVDDQASGKLSDLSSKLGTGLKTAAKIGAAAVGAAATAITTLTTAAVNNYAEFEQLVGGAELMFGDAFHSVMNNAQEAYKTVQMSQNEYLQQVNGFATGLKTALGGNEQAAADLAHKIIQAEADVVAATGNSQEAVQNAFNGIMKSNFTMLDNLQIGITPTKEGFQEVIDKVNEWNKANGNATKYQMGNLADMQSALVDYIDMVGMSGYAQAEAAGTISGSVASMKSAWSDFLTSLADENADYQWQLDNLLESVKTVAENVLPVVEQVLWSIGDMVEDVLPEIASKIPQIISEVLPRITEIAVKLVESLASGISENQEILMETAFETITFLAASLISMLPQIVDLGLELMVSLAEGIVENVDELLPAVLEAIMAIGEALIDHAPELINAGIELASAIMNGVLEQFQGLEPIIMGVVAAFGAYKAITLASEIASKAMAAGQWLVNAAMNANPIMLIVTLIAGLVAAIITLWNTNEGFRNALINAWEAIKSAATTIFNSVANFFKETIPNAFNSVIAWFKNIGQKFADIGRNIIAGIRQGISSAWNNLVSWFKGLFGNLISIAKKILGIASPSKVFKKIGGFTAEGFGAGFEDEFAHVKDDMEDALNFDDASVGINASIRKVGAGVAGGAFGGTSVGNITINIDGAKYSDENALADAIAERLQMMTDRRSAVYA